MLAVPAADAYGTIGDGRRSSDLDLAVSGHGRSDQARMVETAYEQVEHSYYKPVDIHSWSTAKRRRSTA